MVGLPTCPACGEPRHADLCKPAIQTLLAEEKVDHEADLTRDRRRIAYLELELATAKQELQDERVRHQA